MDVGTHSTTDELSRNQFDLQQRGSWQITIVNAMTLSAFLTFVRCSSGSYVVLSGILMINICLSCFFSETQRRVRCDRQPLGSRAILQTAPKSKFFYPLNPFESFHASRSWTESLLQILLMVWTKLLPPFLFKSKKWVLILLAYLLGMVPFPGSSFSTACIWTAESVLIWLLMIDKASPLFSLR